MAGLDVISPASDGPENEKLFNIARKLSPYLPDKDRPKKQAEILDPSTWELHPPMHGWLD